ncbi:general amidase [Gymnopilus junonius]|uniref:amidase n=1 Tax=Gymnopilus junonius TaxID=109634 RepID=A0A9P5TRL3_GYMJU|nr:general amidase [Gymnopilus junonius]
MATKNWKDLVAEKRERQLSQIPKEWIIKNLPPKETLNVVDFPENCGLLTEKEVEITNTGVDVLLENLASSIWSAVEVTTAFSKRAVIAHQLVNCLTEIFIDRALRRAAELDKHLKSTGKVLGPLHGLPISLKDHIPIKGIEMTMGYASWVGRYSDKNSAIVDVLEACGAVLFVRTNLPQAIMWAETFNHVFGRTLNPFNRSLTPGGSSGGEGALIALKGSPLGVASDIGASVRIPAVFNGLYGLRPSYGRVPYAGCINALEGQEAITFVLGPISDSLEGVKRFMKSVVNHNPWIMDPKVIKKPWNEDEYRLVGHGAGQRLCFAILWHDEIVLPHPPIMRALEHTKQALLAAGHHVVDWKPLKHLEISNVYKILSAGAKEDFLKVTSSSLEPIISTMDPSVDYETSVPSDLPPSRMMVDGVSAYEFWQTQKQRSILRQEYWDHWNATVSMTGTGRPVDAIISPCAPYVAPPHGLNRNINYTVICNSHDYTALVLPTGLTVDPILDVPKPSHKFFSTMDRANYELYDPAKFKDAPIGIQIIGRTLEEEAVIAMGEIVDSAIKAKIKPPTASL